MERELLDLPNSLLLQVIDSMSTTEGKGLLTVCHRLSDLTLPSVPRKRQREVCAFVLFVCGFDFLRFFCTSPSQAAGLVVTASRDRTLLVWRLADGKLLRTLSGHTDSIRTVLAVGSGRVASGGDDRVLRVWDVLSGRQLMAIPTEGDRILCAAPLWGCLVATGHMEGEIRLWSLRDGSSAGVLLGQAGFQISCLAAVALPAAGGGPGSRLLASGSYRTVYLWDLEAGGTCLTAMGGHTDLVSVLADIGGGKLLSGCDAGALRVWDVGVRSCDVAVPDALPEARPPANARFEAARAVAGGAALLSTQCLLRRWRWDAGRKALSLDADAGRLQALLDSEEAYGVEMKAMLLCHAPNLLAPMVLLRPGTDLGEPAAAGARAGEVAGAGGGSGAGLEPCGGGGGGGGAGLGRGMPGWRGAGTGWRRPEVGGGGGRCSSGLGGCSGALVPAPSRGVAQGSGRDSSGHLPPGASTLTHQRRQQRREVRMSSSHD